MHSCCSGYEHKECQPIPFAPLRLVATGLENKPCQLVERTSATQTSEYATLSYCWGNSTHLRTTTATLAKFTRDIPMELMPQTFVDAILIARALHIPHIWIDALCIVQDDNEEWQTEAANMSKIYQGSQLVITAAQSLDSSQGCFPCNENIPQSDELFFRTGPNSLDSRSRLIRVYRNDVRNIATTNSVIGTRGWTLQEQVLSPRNVLCMGRDLHWKCQAGYQTQTGLHFESKRSLNNGGIRFPTRSLQLGDSVLRTTWRDTVEGYSLRKFTYSRDRIPATAGIVQYFESMLNDAPILGLWAKSFARDLAWFRGGGEPQLSDMSGVPSWTWFACQGCVLYTVGDKYQEKKEQCGNFNLVDWIIEWDGAAYTSCLKQAFVLVEGSVKKIPIQPFSEGNAYIPPYFQVFNEDLKPT